MASNTGKTADKEPPGKGGAPVGNVNNLRHGLYSPRLPSNLVYPDRMGNRFRRALELAVLAVHGRIDVLKAALIHSAAEASKIGLANRYRMVALAEAGKLDPDLGLRFDSEYRRCLDMRDRKLAGLGLDRDTRQSVFDALYSASEEPDEDEEPSEPTTAPPRSAGGSKVSKAVQGGNVPNATPSDSKSIDIEEGEAGEGDGGKVQKVAPTDKGG